MKTRLIKTEDYLFLIDEEATVAHNNDWILETHNSIISYSLCLTTEDCQLNKGVYSDKLIIAYLPLREGVKELEGLPQLPLIEDYRVMDMADQHVKNLLLTTEGRMQRWWGFIEGYEAAGKQYTEEDLRDAYAHGWIMRERYNGPDKTGYEGRYPVNWRDMDYEEREEWFFQQFLKYIQPFPVDFIPQMEAVPDYDNHGTGEIFHNNKEALKIIDNTLQGKYVWE